MLGVVVDGLFRRHHSLAGQQIFTGVEIPVVPRKVAAGNLEPDAVAFAK
jgi:hypothetical protein